MTNLNELNQTINPAEIYYFISEDIIPKEHYTIESGKVLISDELYDLIIVANNIALDNNDMFLGVLAKILEVERKRLESIN